MKTKNLLKAIAAVSILTAVFSCTKEIEPEIIHAEKTTETIPSKTYTLTVKARKGDAETRALSLEGKTLTASWKEGEEVDVYKGEGKIGTLTAQSSGTSTTLAGQVTADNLQDGDNLTLKFLSPDYASQEGTLNYIAANCDYATAEVSVSSIDETAGTITIGDARFISQQAVVKFTLKWDAGDSFFYGIERLTIQAGGTEITVTPNPRSNVLFVAMPALDKADIDMTALYGNSEFFYHKEEATFEPGKYYEIGVKMTMVFPIPNEGALREFLASVDEYHNEAIGRLTNNIMLSGDPSGAEVRRGKTLDLNGRTISGNNISRIFLVTEGASLTLTGGGTIKEGKADDGGAIYNSGTLIIEDVTISGNQASNDGGAIHMQGGTLIMTGGTISGNSAGRNCGGVNLTYGANMTMSGGSIENNSAENNDGGIYVGSASTLTMTGGSITGNTAAAAARGSGITVNGTLIMSGNPNISGNTGSNVYLAEGKVIQVDGAFSEGARIGFTLAGGEGTATSGYSAYNGSTDPSVYFFPDDDARRFYFNKEVALTYWYKQTGETTYASLQTLLEKTGYNDQLQYYYDLLDAIFSDTGKPTKAVSYTYHSTDPDGNGVDLSAVIFVPLERTNPLTGICLANHGTIASNEQCPSVSMTQGKAQFEGGFAWKNYVIVMPDYYGFGASADRPQGYLDAENTARNSIDAYLVARKMLDDKATEWKINLPDNHKLYSFGYSQGGFNSMANLKYVTMHPELDIRFDKVICGGSPFDVEGTWNEYVAGRFHNSLAFVPMTVVSINETRHLGFSYGNLFQGTLRNHVQDWILDKTLTTTEISTKITEAYGSDATMSSIMTEQFMSGASNAYDAILKVCQDYSLASLNPSADWVPDKDTKIVLFHSTNDDTVPASNLTTMTTMLARIGHPSGNLRIIEDVYGDHINAVPQFIMELTVFGDEW